MIKTFGCKETEKVFNRQISKKWDLTINKKALQKLRYLHHTDKLFDLRTPPGNRLHSLKGQLKDYYAIRINDQWRIMFKWEDNNAYEVQIIDYH